MPHIKGCGSESPWIRIQFPNWTRILKTISIKNGRRNPIFGAGGVQFNHSKLFIRFFSCLNSHHSFVTLDPNPHLDPEPQWKKTQLDPNPDPPTKMKADPQPCTNHCSCYFYVQMFVSVHEDSHNHYVLFLPDHQGIWPRPRGSAAGSWPRRAAWAAACPQRSWPADSWRAAATASPAIPWSGNGR